MPMMVDPRVHYIKVCGNCRSGSLEKAWKEKRPTTTLTTTNGKSNTLTFLKVKKEESVLEQSRTGDWKLCPLLNFLKCCKFAWTNCRLVTVNVTLMDSFNILYMYVSSPNLLSGQFYADDVPLLHNIDVLLLDHETNKKQVFLISEEFSN